MDFNVFLADKIAWQTKEYDIPTLAKKFKQVSSRQE